jgi:hypothetical protein
MKLPKLLLKVIPRRRPQAARLETIHGLPTPAVTDEPLAGADSR